MMRNSYNMAQKASLLNVVCPSINTLLSESDGRQTCLLCGKEVANSSALKLHMVKTHRSGDASVYESQMGVKKKTVYCCPAKGCPRGPNNADRHFRNIWHVKQHYLNCHAERVHECQECKRKFGTQNRLKQHVKNCGQIFTCSCGCPYSTKEALLTHARIKGHALPAGPDNSPSYKVTGKRDAVEGKTTSQQNKKSSSSSQTKQSFAVPMIFLVPKPLVTNSGSSTSSMVNGCLKHCFPANMNSVGIGELRRLPLQIQPNPIETSCQGKTALATSSGNTGVCKDKQVVLTQVSSGETHIATARNSNVATITDGLFPVSDAFTQTNEQRYDDQFSQTFPELSENQTQTVSLVDLLDYQFNHAFTQTIKFDNVGSASSKSKLTEIETQTPDIVEFFQENVSDAFTQTLQSGNHNQCSQTTNSLFNMITGATQTITEPNLKSGYQDLETPLESCASVDDYALFSSRVTSPLAGGSSDTHSFADRAACTGGASKNLPDLNNTSDTGTSYCTEDILSDAFTQTWPHYSIDQFSQTNWSEYIERSFLDDAQIDFSAMADDSLSPSSNTNDDLIGYELHSVTPETDYPKPPNQSPVSKLGSGLLDSCTQTTVTFDSLIELQNMDDSEDGFQSAVDLMDAGTQTPIFPDSPT